MVRNAALVPNITKSGALRCAASVSQTLGALGTASYAETRKAEMINALGGTVVPTAGEELYARCDAAIVFGGDGTVLGAAKHAAEHDVPVLGINFGHIGYITELEEGEAKLTERLANGDYRIEERMMLDVSVTKNGKSFFFARAFNEAAISRGMISRLADFSVSCDGNPVNHYRADGLIISTPTGSTAYSMAAGGPVIDPSVEVIASTPVCSHSLEAARTLIFGPSSVIRVNITSAERNEAVITVDGRSYFRIDDGEYVVTVKKSDKKVKLIRLKNIPFATMLYKKFGAGK